MPTRHQSPYRVIIRNNHLKGFSGGPLGVVRATTAVRPSPTVVAMRPNGEPAAVDSATYQSRVARARAARATKVALSQVEIVPVGTPPPPRRQTELRARLRILSLRAEWEWGEHEMRAVLKSGGVAVAADADRDRLVQRVRALAAADAAEVAAEDAARAASTAAAAVAAKAAAVAKVERKSASATRKLFRRLGAPAKAKPAGGAVVPDETDRADSDDESVWDSECNSESAPPSWRAKFAARGKRSARPETVAETAAEAIVAPAAPAHGVSAPLQKLLVPGFAEGSHWEGVVEAMVRCGGKCLARPEAVVA